MHVYMESIEKMQALGIVGRHTLCLILLADGRAIISDLQWASNEIVTRYKQTCHRDWFQALALGLSFV